MVFRPFASEPEFLLWQSWAMPVCQTTAVIWLCLHVNRSTKDNIIGSCGPNARSGVQCIFLSRSNGHILGSGHLYFSPLGRVAFGGPRNFLDQFGGLRNFLNPFGGLRKFSDRFGGLWNFLDRFGGLRNFLDQFGGSTKFFIHIWGATKIFRPVWGATKRFRPVWGATKFFRSIWGATKFFRPV